MPAIKFYGQRGGNTPTYPWAIPFAGVSRGQIWSRYIRPMGGGAVAASGLITLLRTMPTIISALRAGLKDVRTESSVQSGSSGRIDYEVPMRWVVGGSIVIVAMIWAVLTFFPIQGAQTQPYQNLFAAVF